MFNRSSRTVIKPEEYSTVHKLCSKVADGLQTSLDVVTAPKTQKVVIRSFVLSGFLVFASLVAIFSYWSFYYSYIPRLSLQQPVWLQYGHSKPPFATLDLKPYGAYLANDQPYDVTLELIVPNTERNIALGNFMVSLKLRSKNDRLIYETSRPGLVSYASPLVSNVHAVLNPRILLLNRPRAQSQSIHVQLVDGKVLQTSSNPIHIAALEVGRNDGHAEATNANELQVYEARLRFDACFEGLKWFMYNHRILSFIIFTTSFLIAEIVAALFAWALLAYARSNRPSPDSTHSTRRNDDEAERKPTRAELRQQIEEADRLEAKDAVLRSRERDVVEGRRMDDPKASVLGVLRDLSDEEVDAGAEGDGWHETEPVGETATEAVKEEEDDETVGGSVTSGERSTLRSFGTRSSGTTASSASKKSD